MSVVSVEIFLLSNKKKPKNKNNKIFWIFCLKNWLTILKYYFWKLWSLCVCSLRHTFLRLFVLYFLFMIQKTEKHLYHNWIIFRTALKIFRLNYYWLNWMSALNCNKLLRITDWFAVVKRPTKPIENASKQPYQLSLQKLIFYRTFFVCNLIFFPVIDVFPVLPFNEHGSVPQKSPLLTGELARRAVLWLTMQKGFKFW